MKNKGITSIMAVIFAVAVMFFAVDGISAGKKFHTKDHKQFRKNCKECHSKGKKLKDGVTVKSLMATEQCKKCHK